LAAVYRHHGWRSPERYLYSTSSSLRDEKIKLVSLIYYLCLIDFSLSSHFLLKEHDCRKPFIGGHDYGCYMFLLTMSAGSASPISRTATERLITTTLP
jgi:hypothetical protein